MKGNVTTPFEFIGYCAKQGKGASCCTVPIVSALATSGVLGIGCDANLETQAGLDLLCSEA